MKKLFLFAPLFALIMFPNCSAQPKGDYEIYCNVIPIATKYHFFLEKKSAIIYKLITGMDYLSPNVSTLKVGESATPTFTVNLINDGSEYTVGVVIQNSAGFYSGMGISTGLVGAVPVSPIGVGLRKK